MGPAESTATPLRVQVVYAPRPGVIDVVRLSLPGGATLADALAASGLPARHGLDAAALRAGVWSRQQPPETPLRDRDRVEIYRALQVDPKEARRQRYRQHLEGRAAAAAAKAARQGPAGGT